MRLDGVRDGWDETGGPSTLLKDVEPTGDDFLVMAPSFRAPTRQGLDALLRVLQLRQALLEFYRVEVHDGRGKAFLRAQIKATNIAMWKLKFMMFVTSRH